MQMMEKSINNKYLVSGALVLAIGVAIVVFAASPQFGQRGQDDLPAVTPDGSTNSAIITIDPSLRNTSGEGSIQISADVTVDIRGYNEINYEHIRLCLYDENGDVLHGEQLGDIHVSDGIYIREFSSNATVETVPKYIIVDHPELRTDSRIAVENRVWLPEQEVYDLRREGLGDIQNQFEFPRTNETGTCG